MKNGSAEKTSLSTPEKKERTEQSSGKKEKNSQTDENERTPSPQKKQRVDDKELS
jgi:hypothetical protein